MAFCTGYQRTSKNPSIASANKARGVPRPISDFADERSPISLDLALEVRQAADSDAAVGAARPELFVRLAICPAGVDFEADVYVVVTAPECG